MEEDPWRNRRLPDAMRVELQHPLGPVLSGAEAFEAVREAARVVTVGDACTLDLAARGRIPDVALVDFKTKREEVAGAGARLAAIGDTVLRVVNPAGMLTRDAWGALDEAFKSASRVRIEVIGEEDLTALAAIDLAPEGTVILYGQPDAGVVLVRADADTKARVRDILGRMV